MGEFLKHLNLQICKHWYISTVGSEQKPIWIKQMKKTHLEILIKTTKSLHEWYDKVYRTWQLNESFVDHEKQRLSILATFRQAVNLSLEALQQWRHHFTHILPTATSIQVLKAKQHKQHNWTEWNSTQFNWTDTV